jgi:glycosyltransferase involved in cell wall biosynthesis
MKPAHVPTGPLPNSVALVHDYLLILRGAERAFHAIAECWPSAPISTLLYDEAATERRFSDHPIKVSQLRHLRVGQGSFRVLLPLFPAAAQRLDVADAKLVISSSSAFAHGVTPAADAVHVCYCYTPFRYAWHERERALSEFPPLLRPAGARLLSSIRRWDVRASERVSHYIAISRLAQERIAECYEREASVIHPPVDVERFELGEPEDWFLVVGEMVRHKNVDVALEAAARTGSPLKVVGTGPDLPQLRRQYADRAEFLGRVSDSELSKLYSRAKAVIQPSVEEFGIVAVEAQAAGRPVLAAGAGGALETVVPGRTGVLTPPRHVGALAEAMREIDALSFDPKAIQAQASRFSRSTFQRKLVEEVERVVASRR